MIENSIWLCILVILHLTSKFQVDCDIKSKDTSNKLPPCRACKVFVESLQKGIQRTSNGKFEGGDTAWEEKKLGSYATSEIRLIEIQEKLCTDVTEGKDQCYNLLEEHDSEIENWWFNHQKEQPDLYEHFCINTFRDCCPDLHYGPNCTPCEGYPDKICSGNGKCKGAGTRKGNGKCNCDVGYTGDKCHACDLNYYESYKDETKLLCSKCHVSCKNKCTKAGPNGCVECKIGWLMNSDKGCMDLDECAAPKSPCTPLQFCVNTEGSYKCMECDRACAGCTGDGPDMCKQCAKGFVLIENICVDSSQENRKQYVFFTRYLTYLGLCIATCIILNKNITLAALVGTTVAIYIAVSEYMLNTPPQIRTDEIAQKLMESNT